MATTATATTVLTGSPVSSNGKHKGAWTSSLLDLLPETGVRYEIIDGELFMSKSPHWHHQETCGNIYMELKIWCRATGLGRVAMTPGVIFDDADDVIPDVAWVRSDRLATLMDEAGHLTGSPDLAVEVLSFGTRNVQRDREAKRLLYDEQGVSEYWIVDWRAQQVEIYRRVASTLQLVETLLVDDTLTSPLLPGFACAVRGLVT